MLVFVTNRDLTVLLYLAFPASHMMDVAKSTFIDSLVCKTRAITISLSVCYHPFFSLVEVFITKLCSD